jgi:N-acetylglucosaminyldiphosphoundecaprenol N-acetyl-beta-D-mannosaminyltransferase
MQLQRDREFLQIYDQADYRLCDSQVLLYASRFLGTPLKQKISGSDFFPAFCNFHRSNPKIQIFLLGGGTDSSERAAERINRRIGRKIVVGTYSPPFGFEQDERECLQIIQRIRQSGATVLAVGVGAPKQEKWIYHYKDRLPMIDLFLAIGATIDFEAGTVKRAPRWISQFGLEWLYRLLVEPQRLWKRYLIRDLPFIWLIFRQKLGLYKFSHHAMSRNNGYDEYNSGSYVRSEPAPAGRYGKS